MNIIDGPEDAGGRAQGQGRIDRSGAAGDQEFIQSLAKGLAVIEAFSETTPQMTLSEVSRRVGLSPGSARRVLRTLHLLGYASVDGTRFELTPRVLQLGYSYLTSLPVASLVRPRLAQLTEEIGANSAVSVLDGSDIVFVARTTARRTERERLSVGSRFPAHTTSAGKVLLADFSLEELEEFFEGQDLDALTPNSITSVADFYQALDRVREEGWALNDQETMVGHRSITVPIKISGEVVAAVGVGAHVGVANLERMTDTFLPALRVAAEDISRLLQDHPQKPRTRS